MKEKFIADFKAAFTPGKIAAACVLFLLAGAIIFFARKAPVVGGAIAKIPGQ